MYSHPMMLLCDMQSKRQPKIVLLCLSACGQKSIGGVVWGQGYLPVASMSQVNLSAGDQRLLVAILHGLE